MVAFVFFLKYDTWRKVMVQSHRKVRAQVEKGSRAVTHTHTVKTLLFLNKNIVYVYLKYVYISNCQTLRKYHGSWNDLGRMTTTMWHTRKSQIAAMNGGQERLF